MDILPIPLAHLDDVWPHVWPHLRRGVEVCGRSREQLAADILDDRVRVWMAASDRAVSAAWLTEIVTHEGKRCLMVFGLGGSDPTAWIEQLETRMAGYAKDERCDLARFAGRKGWSKLLSQCRQVGVIEGEALYQRDIR